MIYFYDTSALLKLFIQEEYSQTLRAQATNVTGVVVSELTWVEMNSALGRRIRQGESQEDVALAALDEFKSKWSDYVVLSPSFEILQSAAQHAQVMGLRAYDSVQLASARQAECAIQGDLVFCTFDKQFNNAARVLGMKVLDV
jgi:uncharacterized protein